MQNEVLKILDYYGPNAQMIKSIEELSELIRALSKAMSRPTSNDEAKNVLEEIADVEIMLMQLRMIFCQDSKIDKIKSEKVKRCLERIMGKG